ncbi:FHA domain-containing protein [Streptomyces sp. BE303]|uniref:FHA domain-containing protein n=1 Tax=Streptomyces sp. BE303 TaxID=3002528 RepID=UPI002E782105|nr:FHA domain-containing protein [Streptomyces sp. BE303]MED7953024.1 FHA domain-containing protein [Streptomyces sp. BE303]
MATVIYCCPVGAPGECPTSGTRGYCQVHFFVELERYDPEQDAPPPPGPAPSAPGTASAAGSPATVPAAAPEAATRPARAAPAQQGRRPEPAARPVVRLALVIAGALLPIRGERRRGGCGLAIGRDDRDCAAIPGLADLNQLSRHHAELSWIDGVLHVRDVGSTNGTFVDDRPVTGPTVVWPGHRLRFAQDIDVQVIEIDEFGAPR